MTRSIVLRPETPTVDRHKVILPLAEVAAFLLPELPNIGLQAIHAETLDDTTYISFVFQREAG